MPASARLPSGTLVEVLCGQPEQKYGVRFSGGLIAASDCSLISRNRTRAAILSLVWKRAMRLAISLAIGPGASSPFDGRIQWRSSSNLPITRGRTSSRQL